MAIETVSPLYTLLNSLFCLISSLRRICLLVAKQECEVREDVLVPTCRVYDPPITHTFVICVLVVPSVVLLPIVGLA